MEWLIKVYQFIQEDRAENYRVLMSLAPLARTPMDKKGGQAMSKYAKSLDRMLDDMTPWSQRSPGRNAHLRGKVKPGEVVVLLDGSESQKDPLYSGAKISRE